MRKLLNTLFVATEGAYLRRDGLNVVVEVERVEKLRVPLHLLSGVAVFGQVSLSPALMGSLAETGVVTAFFGMNGRFLARVEGPVSGNVLLRREQYRVLDDGPACTRIASGFVVGKVLNQRGVLRCVTMGRRWRTRRGMRCRPRPTACRPSRGAPCTKPTWTGCVVTRARRRRFISRFSGMRFG
jgi:CRISPR-associated endonuclease Cas1